MPRSKSVPAYFLHKPTGQARVRINGTDIYLGKYGSPESRTQYARVIAEHCSGGLSAPLPSSDGKYPDITINELLVKAAAHAESFCVEDGEP
jgi:hypothetical protein